MKQTTRLEKIDIPSYSINQEMFNSISHFLGAAIGVVICIIAFFLRIMLGLPSNYFIGLLVFGISAITLYMVSGLYHIEDPNRVIAKKIKRILDHCTIFVLIAGTYTPICLYLMTIHPIGIALLIIEWGLATIGIILNAINMKNKCIEALSMFLYLALGWLIIFSGGFTHLPSIPFIFILVGGIIYTIGSITYGIGHKNLNFHCLFHIFVLLGTIFQTIGVIKLFM